MQHKACCSAQRSLPQAEVLPTAEQLASNALVGTATNAGTTAAHAQQHSDLIAIAGNSFVMGTNENIGFQDDGEGPARLVKLDAFRIAPTTVTNRQFNQFVRETQYVTEAERLGSSFVFYLQVSQALKKTVTPVSNDLVWWVDLPDACWQRPSGPGSSHLTIPEHPVVHISWHDAQAYCEWAGVSLPTEAQWECAARGGLPEKRYAWGDTLQMNQSLPCNIWQGEFPNAPREGWQPEPQAAQSYEPNGFGLFNTVGNVWEWCADWFSSDYHVSTSRENPLYSISTGKRSMRGGSFLCHDSYCNRYRLAARGANTPSTTSSNCGFRVAGNV